VAVCDVDRLRREDARKKAEEHHAEALSKGSYKGCASYNDFREIIDRKDIDAVMISTPDHWHVIPALAAVRAGKDVECEKPLTLTVAEGRALADAVEKHNRVFQTSSENRSVDVYHRLCELVRNGRIGQLKHIAVTLPRGHSIHPAGMEVGPPPEGFDYDLWLGQAPEAPYCPARCHWNFRWILDYSGGQLTDWGAHLIDIAQWANNTEYTGPVEVEGKATFPKEGLYNTATDFSIDYKYANGVTLNVSSSQPGVRFEGTEGWIGNKGWRAALEAEPKTILTSKIGENEIHLYTEPGGEQRNFLDCVKSRKPCYAPAEVGHRTITIAHIGHISMRLGRKLKWDPAKERFVGDDEANKMLRRPMRPPWTL
jgi:predicted dehydrogenase